MKKPTVQDTTLTQELFNPQNKSDINLFYSAEDPQATLEGLVAKDLQGPSGNTFRASMLTAMGVKPKQVMSKLQNSIVLISTYAGLRDPDNNSEFIGTGAHTGHSRIDEQMAESARTLNEHGALANVAYTSGGCDGVWQGTKGMQYSLISRNTMHANMRVQLGVFPEAKGFLGFASCDKEGPAMTATIVHLKKLEKILQKKMVGMIVPGGVMLPDEDPKIYDTGKVQAVGALTNYQKITADEAAFQLCHACNHTGGGCQFFGTAASQQVITEALGLIIPHGACVPSSTRPWQEIASLSAKFLLGLVNDGIGMGDIISEASIRNAMVMMSASGASTNMFMHLAFIAKNAGFEPPDIKEYERIFDAVPRILRVLPNGPKHDKYPQYPSGFPTAFFWAAGGVPELMLKLRPLDLLELDAMTVTGKTVGQNLQVWEESSRREEFRRQLQDTYHIDPDDVIMPLEKGISSSFLFPSGNIFEVSVCKSGSIDRSLMENGVYHKIGTARVFTSEERLRTAIKAREIQPNDIIVLASRGVLGSGLEETYEFTADLKYIDELKKVAILTDARFSGVSTGACIGHITPEAMAGGNIGKLLDGDILEITVDTKARPPRGMVNLIGDLKSGPKNAEYGSRLISSRSLRPDVQADPALSDVVREQLEILRLTGQTFISGFFPTLEEMKNIRGS
jgi:putative YjhG/YagF family dehydratase